METTLTATSGGWTLMQPVTMEALTASTGRYPGAYTSGSSQNGEVWTDVLSHTIQTHVSQQFADQARIAINWSLQGNTAFPVSHFETDMIMRAREQQQVRERRELLRQARKAYRDMMEIAREDI